MCRRQFDACLNFESDFLKVYEGRFPQIHVCDAELIRLITVKDAEYFNDKRRMDFRSDLLNEMPDFQPCMIQMNFEF